MNPDDEVLARVRAALRKAEAETVTADYAEVHPTDLRWLLEQHDHAEKFLAYGAERIRRLEEVRERLAEDIARLEAELELRRAEVERRERDHASLLEMARAEIERLWKASLGTQDRIDEVERAIRKAGTE